MTRALALILTALTGFSGLVYEVAWQKYLATLLGSHSEATAGVLAIFLGGLSVGYWLFGWVTRRVVARAEAANKPPRLLLLYGLIEGSIGIYVIAFPWLFKAVQLLSYSIPHGAAGLGFVVDVLLSALLIGPASVLMGGTIPILTQALSRSLNDATRFHAFVYAFNTAGAFVGALAAGFYLIPHLGLERVMFAMGLINLSAGTIFLLLGVRGRQVVSLSQETPLSQETAVDDPGRGESFVWYAIVALLTGFAMMSMQTTIIRIGVLSFGSSEFTFSMVVATFVLSIALGSFAVSAFTRIPRIVVVLNQWGIAAFFLVLYARLDEAPYWVLVIRQLFRNTDFGFAGYYALGCIALLFVVGIPVVLSGASLPLLFHHMRSKVGHLGDLAGYLYSWNTVGSLLGALLGGYALLFWLDLHEIYRIAMAVLVLASLILTIRVYSLRLLTAAAAIPLLAAIAILPQWDPEILHSGLFRRQGEQPNLFAGARAFLMPHGGRLGPKILFHEDGPTASVVVREYNRENEGISRSLATNGKSDGDTHLDYSTTGLVGLLPALFAEKAETAFAIGWGVGVTAGELAALDSMKRVDVAEISPAVMDAAPLFDFATMGASTNPKIHVIESDAYRALMREEGTYDVIVSQPSHLWAAGVEMLFSKEFLEATRKKLSPGGVYCQFTHQYEIDDEAVALVLRTFASVFEHVSVWQDANRTLLLLGFNDGVRATDHFRLEQRASRPDFKAALERVGIERFPLLLTYELLPFGVLHAMPREGPLQSLYHPRLNHLASRAMFRGDNTAMPFSGFGEASRIGAKNSLLRAYMTRHSGGLTDLERAEIVVRACLTVNRRCIALLAAWRAEEPVSPYFEKTLEFAVTQGYGLSADRIGQISELFERPNDSRAATTAGEAELASREFVDFYHHAAPFSAERLLDTWSRCRTGRASESSCRARAESILSQLQSTKSFDELVAECRASVGVGAACQQGLVRAREIVEDGIVPSDARGVQPRLLSGRRVGEITPGASARTR